MDLLDFTNYAILVIVKTVTEEIMRILETIAISLRTQAIHPTTVYNALIDLENNAGIGALSDLEYRLARLVRAMKERNDHATGVAFAWLCSTRAYLEQHGQVMPTLAAPRVVGLHQKVLSLIQTKIQQPVYLSPVVTARHQGV